MQTLLDYGWNQSFQDSYTYFNHPGFEPGRVISVRGHQYKLMSEAGEISAELSGKLMYGRENADLPKVGDWVLFLRYDTLGYLMEILPRQNELSRKMPGRQSERQVLVANVDFALLVQGLDRDFNLMRLERYLFQVQQSDIKPVIILNKADLVLAPRRVPGAGAKAGLPLPGYSVQRGYR
ncbi:MAG: GTPase RsgA [Bacteroidia bacterium]|nr:GTPase RsgA [Bacteroidia bacterium]